MNPIEMLGDPMPWPDRVLGMLGWQWHVRFVLHFVCITRSVSWM